MPDGTIVKSLNRQVVKSADRPGDQRANGALPDDRAFPFESLEVYQLARAFRRRMYRLAGLLPSTERFNLAAQVRSAARSLTNNIAEGCGRFSSRDRRRFMHQARGSLTELMDDISICEDESYAKPEHLSTLRPDALRLFQVLSAYIRYLREEHDKPKNRAT